MSKARRIYGLVINSTLVSPTKFRPPPSSAISLLLLEFYSSSPVCPDVADEDHTCLTRRPDADSFYSLLQMSQHRRHLNQIHSQLVLSGLQSSGFVVTKFVNTCSTLGEIHYARQLFDGMPKPTVFLWNAMIRCYSTHGCFGHALQLYFKMQALGVRPDLFTFACVLKSSTRLISLEVGRVVHGQVFRQWLHHDVFLQNGLLSFYSKCGKITTARMVFDALSDTTIVSWTSIISGYSQNGQPWDALRIYSRMKKNDVEPDWISLVSVVKACADVEDIGHGRSVHCSVIKTGLEREPDLVVSLTAMYVKCGLLKCARFLFSLMEGNDVMLWNAMVSGYAKNGYADEAIELFKRMISQKMEVDSIAVRSAISACAQLGSMELAKWVADYARKSGYGDDDILVSTALIDMYSKCGDLPSARELFDRIPERDVFVWSAMITAYGLHGYAREAIHLFQMMKMTTVAPNDVTFLGLLTACKHSGLVEDGRELYQSMKSLGIVPRHQHCACMVDLLGRAGRLKEAYKFVLNMPLQPGPTVWSALLSACRIHRHVRLGEYAAAKFLELEPVNSRVYVQLSNLNASSNMWNHVARVRVLMTKKGMSKDLVYSAIEIDGELKAFRVGDRSHPRTKQIMGKLQELNTKLMEAGFVPHIESALHDLDCEDTRQILSNHSEMIAIAYGLVSTPPGTTLRIMKNLRACVNCHSAAKLISKIVGREIIVRDANRFHYFKGGICSCGDYW